MRNAQRPVDDYDTLREDRRFGFYWYSGLWRLLRPILIFSASLLIVAGLCVWAWGKIDTHFLSPMEPGGEPVAFSVKSGSSLSKVANNLEDQNLIHNRTFFKYYCDFAGLGQKIQAGDYLISPGMDMFEIADLLTTGDGSPITARMTVIPGNTVEDIAAMLQKKGLLSDTAEFLNICRTGQGVEDYWFIDEMLHQKYASQCKYLLEGFLAANTYEVYTGAAPLDIIRKLLSQTDKVYLAEWQDRAQELGMTMNEVFTMASMIEKEAKTQDFDKVSAVFHNRLKSNMKLQSDPTVHYVTGEKRMSLRESDLAVSSVYNTYQVKGLPPGPICAPSPDAVCAALYPNADFIAKNMLYFCCKDPASGELCFNATLKEHEEAVALYAPLWKAYDEEHGL